jgi:hypothetical protein
MLLDNLIFKIIKFMIRNAMNIMDGIIWVTIGLIPMFGGLELAWRLATKKLKVIRKTECALI